MRLVDLTLAIGKAILNKKRTIVTKAQTTLGIEGEGIKNIISPHDGGYILIKW